MALVPCAFRAMKKTKNHKSEVLLLAGLIAVGAILALMLLFTRQEGAFVEVQVSGQVTERFSLLNDVQYTIHGADGGTNFLIIQDGEAWLEDADCPDALCVGMGKIHLNGQSIVCLPHEVVVEIVGGATAQTGVDLVAG